MLFTKMSLQQKLGQPYIPLPILTHTLAVSSELNWPNLEVSNESANSIDVKWKSRNDGKSTKYLVLYGKSSAGKLDQNKVVNKGPGVCCVTLNGLDRATEYDIQVKEKDTDDCSSTIKAKTKAEGELIP